MSIDDIITLLLILTFVAGPILNRLTKGPQKPQQKRPPKNQPRQGQARETSQRTTSTPQTGRESRRQQTTSQTTTAPPPKQFESSDPFTKRLEEARRRVQEAMEGGTSQGDVSQKPQERGLVGSESSGGMFRDPPQSQQRPQQPQQQPASPLTQPPSQRRTLSPEGGAETQRSIPTQPGGFSRTSAQAAKARIKTPSGTKPLQVQRSVGRKRAKLEGRFLTFGRDDLLRGIVWKQILDEPRGKRPWRNPSQHP